MTWGMSWLPQPFLPLVSLEGRGRQSPRCTEDTPWFFLQARLVLRSRNGSLCRPGRSVRSCFLSPFRYASCELHGLCPGVSFRRSLAAIWRRHAVVRRLLAVPNKHLWMPAADQWGVDILWPCV